MGILWWTLLKQSTEKGVKQKVLWRNLEVNLNLQVNSWTLCVSMKVTPGELVASWHKGNCKRFSDKNFGGSNNIALLRRKYEMNN